MQDIIKISMQIKKQALSQVKADVLAVAVFQDAKPEGQLKELDETLGGAISRAMELGDFTGKKGSSTVLYGSEKTSAARIMLLGLGEKGKLEQDTIRMAAVNAANNAVSVKAKTLAVDLCGFGEEIEAETVARSVAEGVFLGGYRYDEFVTAAENGRGKELKAVLVDSDGVNTKAYKAGGAQGEILGAAQQYARTIANRPGNVIFPESLAAEAKKMAKQGGIDCQIWTKAELTKKKMGGILAVGAGSAKEPRLIILHYKPTGNKKYPKIGLVGKAVTFDSGGISIKPGAGMDQMKLDKSGGIAVLGAMKAISELKPNVEVYGIIPSAENMPSGESYRPGDIITTYSGKTVEILNTDAEGRMILCDGLAWANEQGCEVIVDIATLTGACMVALGKYKAGLMSNDDGVVEELKSAANETGEPVWHLPCGDEYLEEMKSKIADLKNTGSRYGGASTAASFLSQFIGETKWAHVDMAGVDMFEDSKKYGSTGSTGYGVRLLTRFVLNRQKK